MSKLKEDRWNSNPPQVTSYIIFPNSSLLSCTPTSKHKHLSLPCGFGWRFELVKRCASSPLQPAFVQKPTRVVDITFKPSLCHRMDLNNISIHVKVTRPDLKESEPDDMWCKSVSMVNESQMIGTYNEPHDYNGLTFFEITLIFPETYQIPLPSTAFTDTNKILCLSLSQPTFIDTKFYLFSTMVNGRPTAPKPVFANSRMLFDSCTYLHDLLSPSGFQEGTPCCLEEDDRDVIAKLQYDAYDYDSDSDLESLDEMNETLEREGLTINQEAQATKTSKGVVNGKAFVINGTAYRTWKAFIYYIYTNETYFNLLKSGKAIPDASDLPYCSPKSMYRLADYANLPSLKNTAKEAIQGRLTARNIVAELFSSFTCKYRELVELEVDFLMDIMSKESVLRELDKILRKVVSGEKPHCFEVLAFTMRRLHGETTQQAWAALAGAMEEGSCDSLLVSGGTRTTPSSKKTSSGLSR